MMQKQGSVLLVLKRIKIIDIHSTIFSPPKNMTLILIGLEVTMKQSTYTYTCIHIYIRQKKNSAYDQDWSYCTQPKSLGYSNSIHTKDAQNYYSCVHMYQPIFDSLM